MSSFFGTRFSQNQLKIRPMNSNKRLPWELNCGFAWSSSPWNSRQKEKIYVKTWTNKKEQNEGTQTINFGCVVPHICHLFVTNFHYDGNIRRRLEARNNQLAMRNQPMWLYVSNPVSLLSMIKSTFSFETSISRLCFKPVFKAFLFLFDFKNNTNQITFHSAWPRGWHSKDPFLT